MSKPSRHLTSFLALMLGTALLLSSLFLVAEAFHHCDKEFCPICEVQKASEGNQLSPLPAEAGAFLSGIFLFPWKPLTSPASRKTITPVSLKDRLDD